MYKRPYSAETKFAALTALERNGNNFYQTWKETGISVPTLLRWKSDAEKRGELPINGRAFVPLEDDKTPLGDHLEQIVRQMVSVMPRRVEEASLQELTRSLTSILATMNQVRTGKAKTSHAHEKLAEILERYAAAAGTEGTPEPIDGE